MRYKLFDAAPTPLGEVEVGDIIEGLYEKIPLEVKSKIQLNDGSFLYECEYIRGPFVGETTPIYSYYIYRRI